MNRIYISGYTTRGIEIDFPKYVHSPISYDDIAKKIAKKNGLDYITARPDGIDNGTQQYVATLGKRLRSGGYEPKCEIRFSCEYGELNEEIEMEMNE